MGKNGGSIPTPTRIDPLLLTLPETNSKFAPENGWDWNTRTFPIGVPAYFQGQKVSFREGSRLLGVENI